MDPAAIAAAVFEEMDLDGSGTLEREEVDLAARKLGQSLSVDELEGRGRYWRVRSDGTRYRSKG